MKIPVSYLRMSENALRKHISHRKFPAGYVDSLLAQAAVLRQAKRVRLKTDEQHARLWGDLISPAKAERRIVQRMLTLNLTHASPERTLALEAYLMVLDVLIGRLVLDARNCGLTPRQLAEDRGLPNKGEHWTDWMPKKKIALIEQYFACIPAVRGIKQKRPFERRIPQTQHAVHKKRLIERTGKEIAVLERRIAAELADTRLTDTHVFKQQEINDMRVQISRMQAALHTIALLRPTDFVPVTWHGIYIPD